MKTIQGLLLSLCAISFSTLYTQAQLKPKSSNAGRDSTHIMLVAVNNPKNQDAEKTHLDAEFKYLSNQVYLGRRDSAALPYYIPTISYFHKSGLYASASLNYLKNSAVSRIDLVTLEAGYDFTKGKYEGKLSFTEFFYNSQSTSVTSELNSTLSYENNLDLGFLKSTVTGGLDIGAALDFVLFMGASHEFSLFNDKVEINPSFGMNIASQNNYNAYYKNKKFGSSHSSHGGQGSNTTVSGNIINANAFQIKDYELSVPISYSLGKCSLNFTPNYGCL